MGDIDNDGFEDVYVTNFGVNRLYRNVNGRRFDDVAGKAGVALDSWTTGCAFGDYDGDGLLDLFVAGYVALDLANLPPSPSHPATGGSAPAPATSGAGRRRHGGILLGGRNRVHVPGPAGDVRPARA